MPPSKERIDVLNPATDDWIVCVIDYDRLNHVVTVTDARDASVSSSFALPGTALVRLDGAYGVRLEHSGIGGALSLRCSDAIQYAKWTDIFSAAGVQRAGSTRDQKKSVSLQGWIVKKEKPEPKKRRVFCVLRDSQLDCFDSDTAAAAALNSTTNSGSTTTTTSSSSSSNTNNNNSSVATASTSSSSSAGAPRSFDLWTAVVTMTPESHKRVFAVYPDGEQQPFLLQCKDADDFKLWFGRVSEAAGSASDESNATMVFGAPLAAIMNRQGRRPPIPIVMAATVDYLETNAMRSERLFHQTPSAASTERCERFIEQYNTGVDVRLTRCEDPIAIALLFRSYLEQLPEPLLTFERHQAFMGCFKGGSTSGPDEASVLDEIAALPEDNFVLIKFVCRFFYDFVQHSNKTSVRDLAELFGPIFCRPQDKRSTLRHEMIVPLAEMLIMIQRNAPTNIIYKLKDDRKKLCIALFAYKGRTDRELSFEAGTVITVLKKDKSGWWKGGVMRVYDQKKSTSASAAKKRVSRQMEVGWFPHDFVEEYVPGRQTEQLIAGGLNLQEAAVRSGAVDATTALAALKALRAQADDASSTDNSSGEKAVVGASPASPGRANNAAAAAPAAAASPGTTKGGGLAAAMVDLSGVKRETNARLAAAEAAAVELLTPRDDTEVVSTGGDVANPPTQLPVLSPKNVGYIETADGVGGDGAAAAAAASPTATVVEAVLNTAKTRGLRTLKALFERKLITADERKALGRKCLALDENTLAVLESFQDDYDDCATQLRDLVL